MLAASVTFLSLLQAITRYVDMKAGDRLDREVKVGHPPACLPRYVYCVVTTLLLEEHSLGWFGRGACESGACCATQDVFISCFVQCSCYRIDIVFRCSVSGREHEGVDGC